MQKIRFAIEDIHIGERTRPLDEARVGELASSIREIGLLHPVTVRIVPSLIVDGEEYLSVPVLVMGRHRLAALSANGELEVECQVIDVDDLRAELAEIDENLLRVNLTPAQEAAHIARRKEIYEAIHPETRSGTAGGRARQGSANDKLSFAASTAAASHKNIRSVQRSAERGRKLGPDLLDKVAGTSLDKGAELDALAALPVEERTDLVARAAAGETVSARPQTAQSEPEPAPQDQLTPLERAQALWWELGFPDRQQFLSWAAVRLQGEAA